MTKTIVLRESYDWLTMSDVTKEQYEELNNYIEEKYPHQKVLDQSYNRLRFINYVGVIQCRDVTYEIIPKISLTEKEDRNALLSMLAITNFLPISFFEKLEEGEQHSELLTAFLLSFLNKLLPELKRGPYKTYERHEENVYVMKGKLKLSKHIRRNAFFPTRAYCSFDEYTENNILNQILKLALNIVQQSTAYYLLKLQLERCLRLLDNVELVTVSKSVLESFKLNRQNERFQEAFLFAKLIIQQASIFNKGKNKSSFSFMFPMNILFEKYIEVALIEAVGQESVISQHAETRLLRNQRTGQRNILLKPDFVVNQNLIIDTKWKSALYHGKSRYKQADIYQMYAYVTAYKNVDRCILLYPKQAGEVEHPKWEVLDTNKTIEMAEIRIDDFKETIRELKIILNV